MGLDASVYCDCFERGRLRTQPRPEWGVHLDEDGGRAPATQDLEEQMAFDSWHLPETCEHEGGRPGHCTGLREAAEGASFMDASRLIGAWKQRLIAFAEHPEFVFRDTPRHVIEHHCRRLTPFAGYPEPQVAEAEARLGVRF